MTQKQKKNALIDKIRLFVSSSGVLKTLEQKGVRSYDIPLLSKNAIQDPCIITNPRKIIKDDVEAIMKNAM